MKKREHSCGGYGLQCLLNGFVIGLLLLCFLTMALIPSYSFFRITSRQTERFCSIIVDQTQGGFIKTIKYMDEKLISFTRSRMVYDEICRGQGTDISQTDFRTSFLDFFPISGMDYPYVQSVDLYVKKTGQLFRVGYCPTTLNEPFSRNNSYRKAALYNPQIFHWLGYNEELNALEGTKLIFDTKTYEELGLMIVRISPSFFLKEFKNFSSLDIQNMYLLDQSDRVLSSLDSSKINQRMIIPSDREMYQKGNMTYYSRDLKSLDITRYSDPYSKWRIVVEVNSSPLYSDMYTMLFRTFVTATLLLSLGILMAVLFSRTITRPLLRVAEGFKSIEQEDYTQQLSEQSTIVETQIIINGYNHLLTHLNRLINTVYLEKMAVDELRFKSLQATINPHFLFNTLQLISWKARAYHADEVCSMVKSLSFMLETSLMPDNSPFITIKEELTYLEHYMHIIRCKYEEKITFNIDIPEVYQYSLIPRLTIQPLIENSISHGLVPKMGKGSVNIQVEVLDGILNFCISDNGVGMTPEQLLTIRESLREEDKNGSDVMPSVGHKIALINIYRRLQILYQDEFAFSIDSCPFSGTCIRIRIPDRTREDCKHV